jgi:glycerol-3-phosphate dehydrogenase
MASIEHDVVVIGGGVHGACAAWEAARRGLRVALVEAADFGHATSGNSLRTFHGGIRYLQQLDFQRMRESIRERREWLRLAPHLVHPMRFVLPTVGHGIRGPEVLGAALVANDLVGADRNRGVRADQALPRGEFWSASRARQALDGLDVEGLNGAAAWYDAVCTNTERLLISIVAAAAAAGAHVANYARVVALKRRAGAACGVRIRDELNGATFDLRAGAVINAAGPWVDEALALGTSHAHPRIFGASDALGLSCERRDALEKGTSTYFVIPWNGHSLVGTRHLRCDPAARTCPISPAEVQEFLADLNGVLGRYRLTTADVQGVFCGLLPEHEENPGSEVALVKTARVIDHGVEDAIAGFYSVVGIKWTTARAVAERAVVMACTYLGERAAPPAEPRTLETYGFRAFAIEELIARDATLAEPIVLDLPAVKAQVVYATRYEMARRLWDVVRRRMPLYLSRAIDEPALAVCASLMQRELDWTQAGTAQQIAEAADELQAFRSFGGREAARIDQRSTAHAKVPMSSTGS